MRHVAGALLLLGTCLGAGGQEAKKAPEPSPELLLVARFDEQRLELIVWVVRYQETAREREVTSPAGVTTVVRDKVSIPITAFRSFKLRDCKVQEASGKAIAANELAKRLSAGSAVVVAQNGKLPTKAFLQALHAETVVVVPPVTNSPRPKLLPKELP